MSRFSRSSVSGNVAAPREPIASEGADTSASSSGSHHAGVPVTHHETTHPKPVKGVKKQHLPEKLCATCGRLFTWRKKWERVWDAVKYCSDRCRMGKRPTRND